MRKKAYISKEAETIAVRRATRLAERLRLGANFVVPKAWWTNPLFEILALVFIFLLNFYVLFPFFGTHGPDVAYSGPVIPIAARAVELFRVEFSYSVQIINLLFLLIFPFSFYCFVKEVTGRKSIALLAVLISSLPFSIFAKARITASLLGGDGAHLSALTIIPIATLGVVQFVRKGGVVSLIAASLYSAFIALMSPFGLMTYVIIAIVFAFSEMLLGGARLKLARLATVLFFSGALTSFWYNPGFFFWMVTGPMGEDIRFLLSKLVPISFFIIPALASFGFLLFDRKPNLQPIFLGTFYTIAFLAIVIAGGGFFPSHPSRYAPELGISLAFLCAMIIVKVSDYLKFASFNIPLSEWQRLAIGNFVLLVSGLCLTLALFLGRRGIVESREQVLGIWTGIERGEIWKAREGVGFVSSAAGHVITGMAVAGLSFLGVKKKI